MKNRNNIFLISVFFPALCIALLSGCTPPDPRVVSHTTMGTLEVGMTPSEAQSATGATPNPVLTFDLNGQNWSASYFLHRSGDSYSRYLVLYDDSGLRFWGFVHEFERQRDEEITAAARKAEVEFSKWSSTQAAARNSEVGNSSDSDF